MKKITADYLKSQIVRVTYTRPSAQADSTLTLCVLKMTNGLEITGESACLNPADFDQEIGEKIAYDNAFAKLWQLEGYQRATLAKYGIETLTELVDNMRELSRRRINEKLAAGKESEKLTISKGSVFSATAIEALRKKISDRTLAGLFKGSEGGVVGGPIPTPTKAELLHRLSMHEHLVPTGYRGITDPDQVKRAIADAAMPPLDVRREWSRQMIEAALAAAERNTPTTLPTFRIWYAGTDINEEPCGYADFKAASARDAARAFHAKYPDGKYTICYTRML